MLDKLLKMDSALLTIKTQIAKYTALFEADGTIDAAERAILNALEADAKRIDEKLGKVIVKAKAVATEKPVTTEKTEELAVGGMEEVAAVPLMSGDEKGAGDIEEENNFIHNELLELEFDFRVKSIKISISGGLGVSINRKSNTTQGNEYLLSIGREEMISNEIIKIQGNNSYSAEVGVKITVEDLQKGTKVNVEKKIKISAIQFYITLNIKMVIHEKPVTHDGFKDLYDTMMDNVNKEKTGLAINITNMLETALKIGSAYAEAYDNYSKTLNEEKVAVDNEIEMWKAFATFIGGGYLIPLEAFFETAKRIEKLGYMGKYAEYLGSEAKDKIVIVGIQNLSIPKVGDGVKNVEKIPQVYQNEVIGNVYYSLNVSLATIKNFENEAVIAKDRIITMKNRKEKINIEEEWIAFKKLWFPYLYIIEELGNIKVSPYDGKITAIDVELMFWSKLFKKNKIIKKMRSAGGRGGVYVESDVPLVEYKRPILSRMLELSKARNLGFSYDVKYIEDTFEDETIKLILWAQKQ